MESIFFGSLVFMNGTWNFVGDQIGNLWGVQVMLVNDYL